MARKPSRGGGSKASTALSRRSGVATSAPLSSTSSNSGSAKPFSSTTQTVADDEVDKIPIASLTLDTPLIPLVRPRRVPAKPFPFLTIPSELRIKIYDYYFDDIDPKEVLDLGPGNYKRIHKKLGLMRVCKQVHAEATHYFYRNRIFRLFPTYPGRYIKSKRPLLARLKPHQRECLTVLQLRLGPGFAAPPRGWVVNDALGLKDCVNVQKLAVFIEIDPSDKAIEGFRRSNGFYEEFSSNLLQKLLESLPGVRVIEFDGWPSVKKSGSMMKCLLDVARRSGHRIEWGPEKGWTDAEEEEVITKRSPPYTGDMTISEYAALNLVIAA